MSEGSSIYVPEHLVNLRKEQILDFSHKNVTALAPIKHFQSVHPTIKHRYIQGINLTNNRLTDLKRVEAFVKSIMHAPELLVWIDFSNNYIQELDSSLQKFPKLQVLYFHSNKISDFKEIKKLQSIKSLRVATFYANPITKIDTDYYNKVVKFLPQLKKLDFDYVGKGRLAKTEDSGSSCESSSIGPCNLNTKLVGAGISNGTPSGTPGGTPARTPTETPRTSGQISKPQTVYEVLRPSQQSTVPMVGSRATSAHSTARSTMSSIDYFQNSSKDTFAFEDQPITISKRDIEELKKAADAGSIRKFDLSQLHRLMGKRPSSIKTDQTPFKKDIKSALARHSGSNEGTKKNVQIVAPTSIDQRTPKTSSSKIEYGKVIIPKKK